MEDRKEVSRYHQANNISRIIKLAGSWGSSFIKELELTSSSLNRNKIKIAELIFSSTLIRTAETFSDNRNEMSFCSGRETN